MIFLLMLQKVYKLIDPSTSKETNNYSYIENTNKKIDNSKVNFFKSIDYSNLIIHLMYLILDYKIQIQQYLLQHQIHHYSLIMIHFYLLPLPLLIITILV